MAEVLLACKLSPGLFLVFRVRLLAGFLVCCLGLSRIRMLFVPALAGVRDSCGFVTKGM